MYLYRFEDPQGAVTSPEHQAWWRAGVCSACHQRFKVIYVIAESKVIAQTLLNMKDGFCAEHLAEFICDSRLKIGPGR